MGVQYDKSPAPGAPGDGWPYNDLSLFMKMGFPVIIHLVLSTGNEDKTFEVCMSDQADHAIHFL